MDTFFAVPTSTSYRPLSTSPSVIVEDIVTPIAPIVSSTFSTYTTPIRTVISNIPRVGIATGLGFSTVYNPQSLYYYDSGIGENPLAQYETNRDLRYKFLDKWLYEDYPDILRMMKVEGNKVIVLSKSDAEKNDISKDTESDLEKKSDFIGMEILTLSKNKKILNMLCMKNNMKYYDLPHNEHYVRKAQAKYVKRKLLEMVSQR